MAEPRGLRSMGDGAGVSPLFVYPFKVISMGKAGRWTVALLGGGGDLDSEVVAAVARLTGKGGGARVLVFEGGSGSALGGRDVR